jgi:hypothetical protein
MHMVLLRGAVQRAADVEHVSKGRGKGCIHGMVSCHHNDAGITIANTVLDLSTPEMLTHTGATSSRRSVVQDSGQELQHRRNTTYTCCKMPTWLEAEVAKQGAPALSSCATPAMHAGMSVLPHNPSCTAYQRIW